MQKTAFSVKMYETVINVKMKILQKTVVFVKNKIKKDK